MLESPGGKGLKFLYSRVSRDADVRRKDRAGVLSMPALSELLSLGIAWYFFSCDRTCHSPDGMYTMPAGAWMHERTVEDCLLRATKVHTC